MRYSFFWPFPKNQRQRKNNAKITNNNYNQQWIHHPTKILTKVYYMLTVNHHRCAWIQMKSVFPKGHKKQRACVVCRLKNLLDKNATANLQNSVIGKGFCRHCDTKFTVGLTMFRNRTKAKNKRKILLKRSLFEVRIYFIKVPFPIALFVATNWFKYKNQKSNIVICLLIRINRNGFKLTNIVV